MSSFEYIYLVDGLVHEKKGRVPVRTRAGQPSVAGGQFIFPRKY